jgi:hypothetical protein
LYDHALPAWTRSVLVLEGPEADREIEWYCLIRIRRPKRPTKLHPWSFKEAAVGVCQKPFKRLLNRRLTKAEGRLQVEENLLADVLG